MKDLTASKRVATYRRRQRIDGLDRVEVRVSSRDRDIVQRVAEELRRRRQAVNSPSVAFILRTINAPRPTPIDGDTLLDCLLSRTVIDKWAPHLEAFFTEVSIEATHHLVMSGFCTFEDLRLAQHVWDYRKGEKHDWIEEMADLVLVGNARGDLTHSARSSHRD